MANASHLGAGLGRNTGEKGGNDMVNRVRVTIAGANYAIATTDSEKYITEMAQKLDEDIGKLIQENPQLSVTKAAVFCAMDYLDEYRKSTGSVENMRSQIQGYIADAAKAKLAEEKARAEAESLRREVETLREQLAGRGNANV
jgi:cell division protein ZapA